MRGSSWGKACRLASDSRVPKSSSVPARLSPLPPTVRRRSRIPQPKRSTTVRAASRSALSAAECAPTQAALEARVRADSAEPGQLVVKVKRASFIGDGRLARGSVIRGIEFARMRYINFLQNLCSRE